MTTSREQFTSDGIHYTDLEVNAVKVVVLNALRMLRCHDPEAQSTCSAASTAGNAGESLACSTNVP